MIRVAQIGLGPIGCSIARQAHGQPGMQLVGAVDIAPAIVGTDLGALVGRSPLGVTVHDSIEEMIDEVRPQLALHATGSRLTDVAPQLRSLLDRGVSVVSTCEELVYPFRGHPELSRDLNEAAVRSGAVLLGSGINPGFLMDKLVVTVICACQAVDAVHVHRTIDASTRREPFQRKVGAGLDLAEFRSRADDGKLGHVGLPESAHMIADAMGVDDERRFEDTLAPVLAGDGRVLGVEQSAWIETGGRERVRLEFRAYLGAPRPRDVMRIEGPEPIEFEAPAGVPGDQGTAAVMVHAASCVPEMSAGLRTMLDVPLCPSGRRR